MSTISHGDTANFYREKKGNVLEWHQVWLELSVDAEVVSAKQFICAIDDMSQAARTGDMSNIRSFCP